ncbi:hypothetical protein F5Y16DRAFT_399031 [Xylariaceae sp. FL0255]|nr:hypothetical protein F5Y16DRAFT_399031 [Xylariaceae sp. FL0255]
MSDIDILNHFALLGNKVRIMGNCVQTHYGLILEFSPEGEILPRLMQFSGHRRRAVSINGVLSPNINGNSNNSANISGGSDKGNDNASTPQKGELKYHLCPEYNKSFLYCEDEDKDGQEVSACTSQANDTNETFEWTSQNCTDYRALRTGGVYQPYGAESNKGIGFHGDKPRTRFPDVVAVSECVLEERYGRAWVHTDYLSWVNYYKEAFEKTNARQGEFYKAPVFADAEEEKVWVLEGMLLAAWLALQPNVTSVDYAPHFLYANTLFRKDHLGYDIKFFLKNVSGSLQHCNQEFIRAWETQQRLRGADNQEKKARDQSSGSATVNDSPKKESDSRADESNTITARFSLLSMETKRYGTATTNVSPGEQSTAATNGSQCKGSTTTNGSPLQTSTRLSFDQLRLLYNPTGLSSRHYAQDPKRYDSKFYE